MSLADYSTIYLLAGTYILFKAWNRWGGWPIAYYRFRGINYFRAYMHDPTGKYKRLVKRLDKMKNIGGKTYFEHEGGDYCLPEKSDEKFPDDYGQPAGEYNHDDPRPIPVFNREPDGVKISPTLLHAGIKNDKIKQLNEVNHKPDKFKWGLMAFAIILILIFAGYCVYLTYYFGINLSCAVHAKSCV